MSTIRRRLTLHLLLVWVVLLAIGGGVAYSVTRTALTRQFDDALHAKATALAGHIEQNNSHVELELSSQFAGDFDTDGAAFFQISGTDGRVLLRSRSLRDEVIPLHEVGSNAPSRWNLKLNSELAVRAIAMPFQPRRAHEFREADEDQPLERRRARNPVERAASPELVAVVAVDRRNLDNSLSTLAIVLAGSGLLVLTLTAVSVPLLLRLEMAPLDRLTDQTQRITAESLSVRFPTDGLPGELTPIATRLNGLLERLQVSFERERRFSDDLAHELRTPIAEIRSLAELALKWPDGRSAETDRDVLHVALQMEKMVSRLLLIARSDAGQTGLVADRVELAPLVSGVCESYQARTKDRRLAVEVRIPSKLQIESDAVALRSIVANLFENAVEYSPVKSVLQIRCELENGKFALSVTNPVENLEPADVPYLFERFWRKDTARTGGEHAGLGLSLAQALATTIGFSLVAKLTNDRMLTRAAERPGAATASDAFAVG